MDDSKKKNESLVTKPVKDYLSRRKAMKYAGSAVGLFLAMAVLAPVKTANACVICSGTCMAGCKGGCRACTGCSGCSGCTGCTGTAKPSCKSNDRNVSVAVA
jgi:hypothetical protein